MIIVFALLVALLAALLATLLPLHHTQHRRPGNLSFGALLTDPGKARLERANGIDVAQLQIYWSQYEPQDGVYDSDYIGRVKRMAQDFEQAGMRIEVSLGLNHPPAWLLNAPGARYVDQYGDQYADTPNLVFSRQVRSKARDYLARLAQDIDPGKFWAVRVGVNSDGEFSYPPSGAYNGHPNAYWAFDVNAQGTALDQDRPSTIPANPFPGWQPGQHGYRGGPFPSANVDQWYGWYLSALADSVNWQIEQYRALGYNGHLKVLVPGTGYYPVEYRAAIAGYLDGGVEPQLMGLGAGYFTTLGRLRNPGNVYIVPTSLVDGTGDPKNNSCDPADDHQDVFSDQDGAIRRWSSVRWISDISRHNGFPLSGETAGPQVSPYYPGVMNAVAKQLTSCGLQGLMWAFDGNLYDGTPGSSLQDYAAMIRRLS